MNMFLLIEKWENCGVSDGLAVITLQSGCQ